MIHASLDYSPKKLQNVDEEEIIKLLRCLIFADRVYSARILVMTIYGVDYTESIFIVQQTKTLLGSKAPDLKYKKFISPNKFNDLLKAIDNPRFYDFPNRDSLEYKEKTIKDITGHGR
jgi:hypothetical protein